MFQIKVREHYCRCWFCCCLTEGEEWGWGGGGARSRFQNDEFDRNASGFYFQFFSHRRRCSLTLLRPAEQWFCYLESTQFHVANLSSTLNFKIPAVLRTRPSKWKSPFLIRTIIVYIFNFFKWKFSRFFFAREKSNMRVLKDHFSHFICDVHAVGAWHLANRNDKHFYFRRILKSDFQSGLIDLLAKLSIRPSTSINVLGQLCVGFKKRHRQSHHIFELLPYHKTEQTVHIIRKTINCFTINLTTQWKHQLSIKLNVKFIKLRSKRKRYQITIDLFTKLYISHCLLYNSCQFNKTVEKASLHRYEKPINKTEICCSQTTTKKWYLIFMLCIPCNNCNDSLWIKHTMHSTECPRPLAPHNGWTNGRAIGQI